MWRGLGQDVRYGIRALRRNRGFAAIAVGTLALGIGLDTAMFSVLDSVLLSPPPYAEPGRLVTLRQRFPRIGELALGASPAEFVDYRDRAGVFSAVAGHEDVELDLTGDGPPARVRAARVTHTLFATLGVAPALGRAFAPSEDAEGGAKVVLLGHDLWQRRFGGDRSVVGRTIRLEERPHTVIGVMPAGFEFPFGRTSIGDPPALWVPMAFTSKELADRAAEFPVKVVARLRPGVTLDAARQDVQRVARDFQREHADIYRGNLVLEAGLEPLGAAAAARVRPVLLALAGAVVFVLLIACANVTNLMLARAAERQREMAVRHALGAGAGRLMAQSLAEALLLTLGGGALGAALAFVLLRVVASRWPWFVAGLAQARVDLRVLAFTLAVSVATGLLCGLAPALGWSAARLGDWLRQAGRQAAAGERHRLRATLVIAETACAVVLCVGAGLLLHSFREVLRVPLGFSTDGVLIARAAFDRQRYPTEDGRRAAERRMAERVAALPGVAAVAVTTHIPLADERQIGFVVEGEDERAVRWADNALVSEGYFAAMGIPILHGRAFGSEDQPGAPMAAVVNDGLARRLWPGGDAVGKRLLWGGRTLTIVGVAGDVHIEALDAAVNPTIYTPLFQVQSGATRRAVFIVRTRLAEPAALAGAVREAVWSVDADVPVFDVRTMGEVVARSLGARRFAVVLLTAFAALAVALAAIGLYGVLAYAVTRRRAELGVRAALGATPSDVIRLVLGEGLRLTAAGIAIGCVAGAATAPAIAHLLFGIGTLDVASFAAAAALLLTTAVAAAFVPAWRASRVDAMVALRAE